MLTHLFSSIQDETSVNRENSSLFVRNTRELDDLRSYTSRSERWHVCEILFAMVFQIMSVGSTAEEVGLIVDTLSKYLEAEWETASKEVSTGVVDVTRSGRREDQFYFSLRASVLILLLLESTPASADFVRSLASVCGSAQSAAAWILCTMVNSYSDPIRGIGVRCLVAYLEVVGKHPDQPINLEDPYISDIEKVKSTETRSLQENTMSLISNVGHGLLNSNVGKGLAAMGPSIMLKSQPTSKLTPRVAYKLLWHLLKSHRYRIHSWTQGSLVAMVYKHKRDFSFLDFLSVKQNFLKSDDVFHDSLTLDWAWVELTIQENGICDDDSIRHDLGVNTIMRLLRFLPDEYIDQWLRYFVNVSPRNARVLESLAATQDWQPYIFQLSSELTEKLVVSVTKDGGLGTSKSNCDDSNLTNTCMDAGCNKIAEDEAVVQRLDLALELHAILLGNLFRHGEEKALGAIEVAASLQRVCLNGQKVLLLLLTKLFSNLSTFGVLPVERLTSDIALSDNETGNTLLKQSAKLVTDTILSNTTKGITMPAAVDCWRCLRHLNAVVVAMITRLG